VREKNREHATLLYVGESLVYRTVGMMDVALGEVDKSAGAMKKPARRSRNTRSSARSSRSGVGDGRLHCRRNSADLSGYGFVEEYPRSAPIRRPHYRIFEAPTKSPVIIRLPTEASHERQLPLMPAIKKLMDEVLSGPSAGEELDGLSPRNVKLSAKPKSSAVRRRAATQKYMQRFRTRGNHGAMPT